MINHKSLLPLLLAALPLAASAQNPIITTTFASDPAPYVHGDTVYVFTDHDEDDALYFKMREWQLYSTTDMVNWTYRGAPISTETFQWAKQGDNAWASQAVERDGRWYWYVCAEDTTVHLHGIGVAVADRPEGPYRDALGKPLVPGGWGYIDPSVFVDDDGQAWLFWGNNGLWYAPLGRDMISLAGDIKPVAGLDDEKSFGPLVMKQDYQLNKKVLKTGYEEGPWVTKRGGLYYLAYAAGGVPEHMAYSTAPSIHGPWTYRGRIMDEAENSFTIHGGNIDFKGHSYMFYHNGTAPNGGGFHRTTAVEEFTWNADGTMPFMPFTKEGVREPVGTINPYGRVEGETMAEQYGLKTDRRAAAPHYLTKVDNGDWLRLRAVDFGEGGARQLVARVAAVAPGATIQLHLDYLGGPLIATLPIAPTGGMNQWQEQTASVKEAPTGVHDVFLLFRGGDDELLRLDWWKLER